MDKTFVFNKNNICTNPNTPISWISEGKPSMGWSFDVFTALTPKGWTCIISNTTKNAKQLFLSCSDSYL